MLKLLIAFILGIIFATAIITIVLTRHKAGTIFYDDTNLLLSFENDRQYDKIHSKKYIIIRCAPFNEPFEVVNTREVTDQEVEK